jgi:hypothetical protein
VLSNELVLEENRVYRALLDRPAPGWRLEEAQRKALAEKGRPLGKHLIHDRDSKLSAGFSSYWTVCRSRKKLETHTVAGVPRVCLNL